MAGVPIERRRRMVDGARQRLIELRSSPPLPCVIPLTANGWERVLDDADTDLEEPLLGQQFDALLAAGALSPEKLRSSAREFAEMVAVVARDLWFIQAFEPAAPDRAETVRIRLIDAALIALDVAVGDLDSDILADPRAAIERAADDLYAVASEFDFPDDECLAAFGVAKEELFDERRVFSTSRLLAAYYGRYHQLSIRFGTLLSVLTRQPPGLHDALLPVQAFVLSRRPLVTLRTAIRIRDLFESKMSEDIDALARPLRELKLRVDRSATSHAALVSRYAQRHDATPAHERAELSLDRYRRMAEGQLRPWGLTLLQVLGRSVNKSVGLSSLRERLVSEGHPLLADAAAAIRPEVRNAAAHEEYVWDDLRSVLRIGDSEVDLDGLDDAADLAEAFMCGAEAAWRCTRIAKPEFAARLDSQDPEYGLAPINVRAAINQFGGNGLRVRRWSHDAGTLTVVLDEIPLQRTNPCFNAVTLASRDLELTESFVVTTPGAEIDAMVLPRPPLDACSAIWDEAFGRFDIVPLSTFLPAQAWVRLAVEPPDAAALASGWLALFDMVRAFTEATHAPGPREVRIRMLVDRLDLVATAVAATIALLPSECVAPLARTNDMARSASVAVAALSGGSTIRASEVARQIWNLYESWPSASVLPTVDSRPLDVIMADQMSDP